MRMRALIAGAAGFIGSHLVDRLLQKGYQVVGIDDLSSGRLSNLESASRFRSFSFCEADICQPLERQLNRRNFDVVVNLASLASPPMYQARPLHTLRTGSIGTLNLLEVATDSQARFVMASTSEIYGDPEIHPQSETYFGNVNPVGERSCYDEAKRFSEALCYTFRERRGTNVGIARIFNTYGPRLRPDDGRVVSNLIRCALTSETFNVNGDGRQTRSLCFIDDMISGLMALVESSAFGPINLGNPAEVSILDLVREVEQVAGRKITTQHVGALGDDPKRRRPDITRATELLKWRPEINLRSGLSRTYQWMRSELRED